MKTTAILLAAGLALAAAPGLAKDAKGCPPGLAKKSPACVPPGLAKKRAHDDDHEARAIRDRRDREDDDREARADRDDTHRNRYRTGERLPAGEYVVLAEGDRVTFDGREYTVVDTDHGVVLRRGDSWYRLPPEDANDYVVLDGQIFRADPKTRAILDLIRITDLILG